MICEIYNNIKSDDIRDRMHEHDTMAEQYPIGPKRSAYVNTLPWVVYCDTQFHVKTKGRWGQGDSAERVICRCPQGRGSALIAAAVEESPEKERPMTWATYIDHSGDGRQVKAWVNGSENILLLTGHSGCGKTHLARAVQFDLTEQGVPVAYITAEQLSRIFMHVHPMNRERIGDLVESRQKLISLKKSAYVIIDDLGTESEKQREPNQTFVAGFKELLDEMSGRLLITANLTLDDQLEKGHVGMYGGRIYSRLISGQKAIPLKGGDFRKRVK